MYVFDTNILILYSKREPHLTNTLEQWTRAGSPLLISTVVEAELLSWHQLTMENIHEIKETLSIFTAIPVDSFVAHTAASLRRRYRTPLIDSIIAATALLQNAPLVTRNAKDFSKIREIEVLKI